MGQEERTAKIKIFPSAREGCLDALVRQSEYVGSLECVCARHTHSSQSACLECNGIIYKGEVVGVERFCSAAGAGKEIRKAKAARKPLLPGALYNGSWLWRG